MALGSAAIRYQVSALAAGAKSNAIRAAIANFMSAEIRFLVEVVYPHPHPHPLPGQGEGTEKKAALVGETRKKGRPGQGDALAAQGDGAEKALAPVAGPNFISPLSGWRLAFP